MNWSGVELQIEGLPCSDVYCLLESRDINLAELRDENENSVSISARRMTNIVCYAGTVSSAVI